MVDVRDNLLAAYEKKTDLPFYVFVSMNLPPLVDLAHYDRWQAELDQTMAGAARCCAPAKAVGVLHQAKRGRTVWRCLIGALIDAFGHDVGHNEVSIEGTVIHDIV